MSLKHALLGLLADHPASGYELTKQFELSLAHVWGAKHSQIYPELQRMAANGWLEVGDEGSRGRKEYAITNAGRAELRHWLVEVPPERATRNESMLRIFFLWSLPADEAAAYLDGEAEYYRDNGRSLGELDDAVPWDDGPVDLMGRIAMEQGRRWSTMMADWAEWAAGQIRAGHDARTLTDRQPG
jgi:PadR family transcriptional regulator, regulatory protein AphA